MKIHRFVETLFAAAFTCALLLVNPSTATSAPSGAQQPGGYSAQLVSPTAGQVLYPGQQVKVEWKSQLPKVQYLEGCEMELVLSLDGGKTFTMRITPLLDPKATYFYWTVPNTPTNQAVLDIHFGCDGFYPECYAPQTASAFVISPAAAEVY